MKKMVKTTKTIKELVNSIPERLGVDPTKIDLSTPEKVLDFFNNTTISQLFSFANGSAGIWDGYYDNGLTLETDHKAMYDINGIFGEEEEIRSQLQKEFNYFDDIYYDCSMDDNGDMEYGLIFHNDELSFFVENNCPYMIQFMDDHEGFNRFIELLQKICKKHSSKIKLTRQILDDKYEIFISESGEITYGDSLFEIVDDNGIRFVTGIVYYLSAFECDSFDSLEKYGMKYECYDYNEKFTIPKECGVTYIYENEEELKKEKDIAKAAAVVSKYPIVLNTLSEAMQKEKEIAKAFISSNDKIIKSANEEASDWRIGRHTKLTGSVERGEKAPSQLNGIIYTEGDHNFCKFAESLDPQLIRYWMNDPELFDMLMQSSMWEWMPIDDELYEKINHGEMIEKYPQYLYILRWYLCSCFSKGERLKLSEHVRRKFNMKNDSNPDEVSIMAVYEIIMDMGEDYLSVLISSYNSFILAKYVSELLRTMPKDKRDEMIKKNIKYAYYIRDTLRNNEKIVQYICDNCPKAGDILSDRIVIKRNLKRSTLDENEICKDCYLC